MAPSHTLPLSYSFCITRHTHTHTASLLHHFTAHYKHLGLSLHLFATQLTQLHLTSSPISFLCHLHFTHGFYFFFCSARTSPHRTTHIYRQMFGSVNKVTDLSIKLLHIYQLPHGMLLKRFNCHLVLLTLPFFKNLKI